MKEVLIAQGWIIYHECNTCGGHRQYFKNKEKPGYEVRCRIRNNTFSILLNNAIIAGPFWGYQLAEKLTQLTNN